MDHDKKKPSGAGGKGRGPKKPYAQREGGDKPARKHDGPKREFTPRAEGAERPRKFERRDDAGNGEGERRPAPRKPYVARDGDKPARKFDGPKREFTPRAEGTERPRKWERRDDAGSGEGERRPAPRKPYVARDGDKPARKFDGPKRDSGPREEGESSFRRQDGAKRAFAGGADGLVRKPRPGRKEREEIRDAGESADGERIARRLARAGVASRRDAEALIAEGRISVNGRVLDTPALNVSARDRIELDGNPIPETERTRLFLFHKPSGVVTTSRDPEGRQTVFDVLPEGLPRLMTIGRLDINTEGLLLMTNDGGLARMLELPATGWLRRYRVRVHGKVDAQALEGLKDGIAVDGVFYGAIEASLDREQGSNAWLSIGLREGKNREVKNVLGALGLDVTRLIRVSFGPFQLGELAEGELRELRGRTLREQLGERLIAESGADFEAPIINEFSNKPVAAEPKKLREATGERPNRKREREEKREDALDRLQTSRPPREHAPRSSSGPQGKSGGGKPGFGKPGAGKQGFGKPGFGKPAGARDEQPAEQKRSRTSNVWMAPGARPMGEKKAAALAARNEGKRYAGKPRPAGKGGKPPSATGPRKPPRGER